MKPAPKTFHVKSFGCQMNVYDGERMGELMAAQGLTATDDQYAADLVVLNTCHIREKATEKVYSDIGRLRKHSGKRGHAADDRGRRLRRAGRGRGDRRAAPRSMSWSARRPITTCPTWSPRPRAAKRRSTPTCPPRRKFGALPARRKVGPTAFLTVQEGCDKFCTYCVVPYTRGAEISRPWQPLVDEAKALVDAGAREITLLGQNVNAWTDGAKDNGLGLHDLIAELDRIAGLARIRYTTSHPNDMTQGLIDAHRDVEKLMPFLHLPVQSGSDRVLNAMNRSHTRDSYLRILDRVRAARPDIALSGDFIVGFPGETDAEFEDTLSLVGEVALRAGVQLQILAPPRHARRDDGRPDPGRGDGRPPPAPAGRAQPRSGRVQRGQRRPHAATC